MLSRRLGVIDLDEAKLAPELELILASNPPPEVYSEYKTGTFRTYILRNPSGDANDSTFLAGQIQAQPTALGLTTAYISSLIDRHFDVGRLIMARVNLLLDGLIYPHRDLVEFEGEGPQTVRLHLMLQTSPNSLHSEEQEVFKIDAGAVWYLNVNAPHSAVNWDNEARLSLVLDFHFEGGDFERLTRALGAPAEPVRMIRRPALSAAEHQSLESLAAIASAATLPEVIGLLTKLHFTRRMGIDECLQWLARIYENAPEAAEVKRLVRFLVQAREPGERFHMAKSVSREMA